MVQEAGKSSALPIKAAALLSGIGYVTAPEGDAAWLIDGGQQSSQC